MKIIFHPVSGEKGYFFTEREKELFVALVEDYDENNTLRSSECGVGNG